MTYQIADQASLLIMTWIRLWSRWKKARGSWGYPSVMEFEDVIKIVKSDSIE